MVIVCICGGLGNQLQQYAMYRKYNKLGVGVKVDLSWFDNDVQAEVATKRAFLLDRFCGIDYEVCTTEEKERLTKPSGMKRLLGRIGLGGKRTYFERCIYDPTIFRYTDVYVEGAFTCDCYYADVLPMLRKEIGFPVGEYYNKDTLERVAQDIGEHYSISLHIRRGDYLDDINKSIYENICTEEYYSKALDCCLEGAGNAKLYVFSDDPGYAREYVASLVRKREKLLPYEVISFNCGADSLFDIYLMSKCDCNITANSTFSYWGARLNCRDDSVKIRPVKHKNSDVFDGYDMLDLYPDWILIDSDGRVYQ